MLTAQTRPAASEAAGSRMTPRQRARFRTAVWIFAALFAAVAAFLLLSAPRGETGIDWTASMSPGGWMAWTLATAAFFYIIAALIVVFTLLAIRFPETPRIGVLRIETTRGDRLFITLLGSAFINLAWLGLDLGPQPWALLVCLIYATAVFRWV